MRILGSVVGSLAVDMFCREAECPKCRRVGPKLVCHNPARCETVLLEQLLHQSFGGFRIAPALDEEVQNFTFIVNRTPKPVAFSPNNDDHLVEVPMIAGPRSAPAQIGGDRQSKLQKPASDSLIGDINASFSEHVLDITKAQRESCIEPDGMTDDFGWKTVTFERQLVHSPSLILNSLFNQPSLCDKARVTAKLIVFAAPDKTSSAKWALSR